MSLIADALRKAENASGAPVGNPPPPRSLWIYRAALLGSVGLVLVGLAQITRHPSAPGKNSYSPSDKIQTASTQKTSGLQILRAAQGEMALTGTLLGNDGESLALINNQIVQPGDQIRGMKVVQVNSNSVELQDPGGKTRTLELQD